MQDSPREGNELIVIIVLMIVMFFELTAMMFMMASLVDGRRKDGSTDRAVKGDK